MRAHSILLGLVSAALALPPRPGEGGQTFAIVQQFQTEQPRLASRLARRHEHHHDEALVDATAEEAWREKYEHDGGGDAATEGVLDAGFSATTSAAVSAPSSHPAMNSHHEEEGEHDHHHSREPPKLVLDEEEILKTHAPDPPSYLDLDRTSEGMPGTMVAHVVLMCLAFFGLLPLAIFLKAGGSHLAILPQVGFLALSLFGFFLGIVYARNTPDRYEGSSHTSWGWFTMALAVILNVVDVVRFLVKFTRFEQRFESMISLASSKVGWSRAEKHVTELHSGLEERTALVDSPSYEHSPGRWSLDQPQILSPSSSRGNSLTFSDSDTVYDSAGPDLGGVNVAAFEPPRSRLQIFVSNGLALAMRLLIVIAYIDVFNGVSVYTGVCRGNYLNGCLAHGIKGSVFFWYGLLTFARYCGGMSVLGWAWNKRPSGSGCTAEFVESFVIFLYGSTNTWMERMGKTGAYSVKDVQHISIAVMFWAAGSLGMLLESRTVRAWLAAPASRASALDPARISAPASSNFSFNPFPALVIGVTGVAMSAHHQTYQFQVEIHALWGYLLAAFSAFRFLTYFFLYLRPPASILPSRPPTEALASIFLACGGVVFVLSTEQITFAAMRHRADDMMAFLNVTFAFVCSVFVWIAVLFGVKGWATNRSEPRSVVESARPKPV
ncbi:hypothetical protein JCM3766R1_004051 [Sporobolomyces carnicolor]